MDSGLHRKLVEKSDDIATIIDSEGVMTYVSPSVEGTLGYEQEELVGEVGFEFQHPDYHDGVAEAIETVLANPGTTQTVETRFRRADGSWCWIESTLQNRLDDEVIDGILVNSRDISERKRREQEYQALANEYKTLFDTVEEGIFFLDIESTESGPVFRFERLNQAYEDQTGLETEEVQGRTPTDVFGEELGTELRANYQRCIRSGEPISYQEELPVETDARFWQTSLAPVIVNGEPTQIIGLTRNVTDRVKRERQLRTQKEQLDEFASVVSHDLRNPLNVAQARTELLTDTCDSKHLTALVEALDRMEELVSDTLTLARQGQIVAEPEPVPVTDLVGVCWKSVSTDEASVDIEDTITIRGDRSRLRHVFENLFRNAIEHGGADVTVRVGAIDEHGVYVEDTGPGIPAETREDVFEPGHTSASGGTGFGLTIVKRIGEAHGWDVDVVDGTDGGARFEFTNVTISRE